MHTFIFLISWDLFWDYTWGLACLYFGTLGLWSFKVFHIYNFLFSWTSSGIFQCFFICEYCAHQNASFMPSLYVLCVQGTPCTGSVRMFVLSGTQPILLWSPTRRRKFNANLHSKLIAKKIKIPILRFVFTSPQVCHTTYTVSTKASSERRLRHDVASSQVTSGNYARIRTIYIAPQISIGLRKSNSISNKTADLDNGEYSTEYLRRHDVLSPRSDFSNQRIAWDSIIA